MVRLVLGAGLLPHVCGDDVGAGDGHERRVLLEAHLGSPGGTAVHDTDRDGLQALFTVGACSGGVIGGMQLRFELVIENSEFFQQFYQEF